MKTILTIIILVLLFVFVPIPVNYTGVADCVQAPCGHYTYATLFRLTMHKLQPDNTQWSY